MPVKTKTSNAARVLLAACVAPAVPAVLVLIWGLYIGDAYAWWAFGLFAIPSYSAMLVIGVPLFLVVRRKGWALNVWRCAGFGALSGVTFSLPVAVIDMLFGANQLAAKLTWAFTFGGTAVLAGAIAGFVFGMIASSSENGLTERNARGQV